MSHVALHPSAAANAARQSHTPREPRPADDQAPATPFEALLAGTSSPDVRPPHSSNDEAPGPQPKAPARNDEPAVAAKPADKTDDAPAPLAGDDSAGDVDPLSDDSTIAADGGTPVPPADDASATTDATEPVDPAPALQAQTLVATPVAPAPTPVQSTPATGETDAPAAAIAAIAAASATDAAQSAAAAGAAQPEKSSDPDTAKAKPPTFTNVLHAGAKTDADAAETTSVDETHPAIATDVTPADALHSAVNRPAHGPQQHNSGEPQHAPPFSDAAPEPAAGAAATHASHTARAADIAAQVDPANAGTPASMVAAPPAIVAAGAAAAQNPAAAVAVPMAGLPVEIAARARDGNNRFEIRLDPPELGRIDVRLDVDRHGNVTSRLVVERAETLDLLRRDAPQLERALQDAGLKTGDNSMQFSLRDQNAGQANLPADDRTLAGGTRVVVADDVAASDRPLQYARLAELRGGVDIRV